MKKVLLFLYCLFPLLINAQQQVLINNVQLFNGKDNKTETVNVLITGNVITRISKDPVATNKSMMVTIIDGQQRFLMPGMIDAHWHSFMCANTMTDMMMGEQSFLFIRAARESEQTLLRGFTAVRDLAGPVFGIKRAIDQGLQPGPRIYASGAMISQTAGHGDFRLPTDPPRMSAREISRPEALGVGIIADGSDEVLVATREQLRHGAAQIKLAAGGGVASLYDPLEATQYSVEEMKAAVQAAADWGTYVTVHAYTTAAIKRAVAAGVKCIDHGHLMDEECVKLLADKGIWLSMQPFGGPNSNTYSDPKQAADSKMVGEGTDHIYQWAKKYKVKLAWGTDMLFNPAATKNQNQQVIRMKNWFSNFEILKMITSDNAQLLALSGPRNPYPGKLGVLEEGALADMLLVDGDVLKNLELLGDPEKNLLLIIKDGKIFKNTIPRP